MTMNIERFHVECEHPVYFEENPDLTVQLLRGGQRSAQHAERGIVLVYLGVDYYYSDARRAIPATEMLTEAIERLTTVRDEPRRLA